MYTLKLFQQQTKITKRTPAVSPPSFLFLTVLVLSGVSQINNAFFDHMQDIVPSGRVFVQQTLYYISLFSFHGICSKRNKAPGRGPPTIGVGKKRGYSVLWFATEGAQHSVPWKRTFLFPRPRMRHFRDLLLCWRKDGRACTFRLPGGDTSKKTLAFPHTIFIHLMIE